MTTNEKCLLVMLMLVILMLVDMSTDYADADMYKKYVLVL